MNRTKWIPVSERKPKPDVKVLAWSEEMAKHDCAISFGKRVVGRVIDECRFENSIGFLFTHWMELPKPPDFSARPSDAKGSVHTFPQAKGVAG